MDRLTDSKVAAELKSNYEGLQRVGIEPSPDHLQYVRLAELEEVYPKLVGGIALCKELLKLAMSDLEDAEDCDSCIYDSECCPGVTDRCQYKWKHYDEAMQLLGEEE
jgi:hypothetical protein